MGSDTRDLILLELRYIRRILERLEAKTQTQGPETLSPPNILSNIKGLDPGHETQTATQTTERK